MSLFSLVILSLAGQACTMSIVLRTLVTKQIPLLDWKMLVNGGSYHPSKETKEEVENIASVASKAEPTFAETIENSYPGNSMKS